MATNTTKLAPTVLPDAEYNHRWSDEANYQLVRKSHDPRFGEIIIYKRKGTNDYIFAKEKLTTSKQAAAADIRELKSRVALNRPGLQRMLGYSTAVKKELCSTSYLTQGFYEFPKSDLAKDIGNRTQNGQGFSEAELSQIASQGLKGLNSLHQEKITHGDIRPQYIGFSHATGEVEILDRLADPAPIEKTQTSHLVNKKNLYMSPELYKRLQGKDKLAKFDPAKNDIYGLGLSILEAGNGQSVQDIYNSNGTINQANLDRHLQNFNGKYRGGYLSNFVSGALAPNEVSRLDAGSLLSQLGSTQSGAYATGGVAGGASAASNFGGHSLFDGSQGYPNLSQTTTTITNQNFPVAQVHAQAQALPVESYTQQAPKEAYVSEAQYNYSQPSTNYSYSNASNYPSFVQQDQFSNTFAQKNRAVQGADSVPPTQSQQQVTVQPQAPVAAAPAQLIAPAPTQTPAPVTPTPAPATPSQANVAPAPTTPTPQTPQTTTASQQWVTTQQPATTVVYNTQTASQANVAPQTTTISQSYVIPQTAPTTTSYTYTTPTTYTTPSSYTYTSSVQPTQYISTQPVQTTQYISSQPIQTTQYISSQPVQTTQYITTPSQSVTETIPYLTTYSNQAPTVFTNAPRYTSFADSKIRPLTPSLSTYYTTPQTIRPLTPQRLSNTYTTTYVTSQPNIVTYAQPTSTITTTSPIITFDSQTRSERVVPTTTITTGGLSGYHQPSTAFQPLNELQTRKSVSFINYNDSKRDLTNVISSAAFAKPAETTTSTQTYTTQTYTPQVITTESSSPFTGSQRKTITFDEFQQIKRRDPNIQLVEAQPVGYQSTVVHEQPIEYSRVIQGDTKTTVSNGNHVTVSENQGYSYSGSKQIADLVRNAENKYSSAQKVETHVSSQPDEQAYVQEYTYGHDQSGYTHTPAYNQDQAAYTTTYTHDAPSYANHNYGHEQPTSSQTWTQGGTTTTTFKYDEHPHVVETQRSSGYGRQSWTTSPEVISTKGPRVSRRYRLENGQKIEITDDAYHKN